MWQHFLVAIAGYGRGPRRNAPSTERIVVPVANLDDVSSVARSAARTRHAGREGSIWPYIETGILDEVLRHRSTIVFTNSRGLAEELTARLNELYAARLQRSPSIAVDAARSSRPTAQPLTVYKVATFLLPTHTTAPSLKTTSNHRAGAEIG